MRPVDLTPHVDASDTRVMLGLVVALTAMSVVSAILRARARGERQLAVAEDFGKRTRAWWLLVAVFMPPILAGGAAVLAMFALASIVVWFEFTRIAGAAALRGWDLVWVVPLTAIHALALADRFPWAVWAVDAAALPLIAILSWRAQLGDWLGAALWRALGFLICVVALSAAPAIALRLGSGWLVFTVIVAQAGDVLQYIFGKAFGRHPLAPRLSPKKTWEGLVGGLAGAACLGAALASLIERGPVAGLGWGLLVALAGTAAGLAMSAAKRRHGAKDFAGWLPGHGGLMDRVDSLCGASVAVYLALAI